MRLNKRVLQFGLLLCTSDARTVISSSESAAVQGAAGNPVKQAPTNDATSKAESTKLSENSKTIKKSNKNQEVQVESEVNKERDAVQDKANLGQVQNEKVQNKEKGQGEGHQVEDGAIQNEEGNMGQGKGQQVNDKAIQIEESGIPEEENEVQVEDEKDALTGEQKEFKQKLGEWYIQMKEKLKSTPENELFDMAYQVVMNIGDDDTREQLISEYKNRGPLPAFSGIDGDRKRMYMRLFQDKDGEWVYLKTKIHLFRKDGIDAWLATGAVRFYSSVKSQCESTSRIVVPSLDESLFISLLFSGMGEPKFETEYVKSLRTILHLGFQNGLLSSATHLIYPEVWDGTALQTDRSENDWWIAENVNFGDSMVMYLCENSWSHETFPDFVKELEKLVTNSGKTQQRYKVPWATAITYDESQQKIIKKPGAETYGFLYQAPQWKQASTGSIIAKKLLEKAKTTNTEEFSADGLFNELQGQFGRVGIFQ